uniref:SOCS box domain-containing protein n=2 Tax=Tetranychus urticae TaxID=32264 RepID=T1K5W7_TETUR
MSLKVDNEAHLDAVFTELYNQCSKSTTNSVFTTELIHNLTCLSIDVRQELVNRVRDGCSPLFLAALRGNVSMVDFLLTECRADVELCGFYEGREDRTLHFVTPLWCASISGHLDVVKVLVKHNANVNSVSDTGSTPVRSACYMTHIEIVKFLIDNGADIYKANHSGGTCLINSVQSTQLCQLLLNHGVEVNAHDIQGETALHYAIKERNFDAVLLLLMHGADVTIRSRHGNDALQQACLKMATPVVRYLLTHYDYPDERIAEAHELLGAAFIDPRLDIQSTLTCWKKALAIRYKDPDNPILKRKVPPKSAYSFATEFETIEELENLSHDMDAIKTQSLLVFERILGPFHRDMISKLFLRAANYADSLQFQRGVDVWKYALSLKIERDTILDHETCYSFEGLVRLFLDFHIKTVSGSHKEYPLFEDVIDTLRLLVADLRPVMKLLTIQPVSKKQQECFDSCLKGITHLIYILYVIRKDASQDRLMRRAIASLIRIDPRDSNDNSLLHLVVSKNNKLEQSYIHITHIFPNADVTQLLLECGAPVDAVNNEQCTPLHVACLRFHYNREVRDVLLEFGAHLDRANTRGTRPFRQLEHVDPTFNHLPYISLRCLAARAVIGYKIPYQGIVPRMLEEFLEIH